MRVSAQRDRGPPSKIYVPMRKFPLVLLLLAGCSTTLEPLLTAPDAKTFDEKLRIHGPVDSWEVSTLQREAQSKDALRARNAASLLTLSREPAAEQSLETLGAATTDEQIWATAAASRLLKEQLGHGSFPKSLERADMIRAGLQSSDVKIYKTAFTLARRLKMPELQAEIPKALKSSDPGVVALGVGALTPEQARERMDELQAALAKADYETFPAMATALVETRDKKAWEVVARSCIEHKKGNALLAFVNEVNFHMTPAIYAFMVSRAARQDEFADYAYDILVSQVVQETYPCDRFLMSLSLPRLKKAAQTKKRDQDPEILVTVVSWGKNPSKNRPDWEQLIHGQAAVDFAEKWLSEHRK